MRIPSGSTDRKVPFVAVDATDKTTRETGLSAFTVYRSREGGTATVFTTPTIAEADATNMPGLYWLTMDEDTTIGASHDVETMALHITCSGMAPVSLAVEIERVKFTEGQSGTMANNAVDADVERIAGTAVTAAAGRMEVNVSHFGGSAGAFASGRPEVNTSHFGGTAGTFASGRPEVNTTHAAGTAWGSGAITAASIAASALNGKGDWNIGKTGYALSAAGVQAIWDALTSALTTVGSVGKLLVDNINATISSRLASASYTAPLDAAGTRAAVGLASANLDTQIGTLATAANLATVAGYLDTEIAAILEDTGTTLDGKIDVIDGIVDAIKAKTDQLTFTVANQVDANVKSVAGTTVTGVGSEADPWGP